MPASRSGNPAKKAAAKKQKQQEEFALTAWNGQMSFDVTMPSGQRARLKRPGIEGLVKAGILENMDTLSNLVQESHIDRVKPSRKSAEREKLAQNIMADPERLAEALEIIDKVCLYVVEQPSLHKVPEEGEEREEGIAYIDYVMLDDKMFILNYAVGGSADLEKFRSGLQEGVADVEDGAGVEASSE